jgi:hypothetical protein
MSLDPKAAVTDGVKACNRIALRFLVASLAVCAIGAAALTGLLHMPFPPPMAPLLVCWALSFLLPVGAALLPIGLFLRQGAVPAADPSNLVWIGPHGFWSFNRRKSVDFDRTPGAGIVLLPIWAFVRGYRWLMGTLSERRLICWLGFSDGTRCKVAWPEEEIRAIFASLRTRAPGLVIGGTRQHRRQFAREPKGMAEISSKGAGDAFALIEQVLAEQARQRRAVVMALVVSAGLAVASAVLAFALHVRPAQGVFAFSGAAAMILLRFVVSRPKADTKTDPALAALRANKKKIVWLFSPDAFDGETLGSGLALVVYAALSTGIVIEIPVGGTGYDRFMHALRELAPRAEVGYSEEREALYAQDPKHPPRLEASATQLAGSTCAGCGKRIVMSTEARACERCGKPVHRKCEIDHERAAHPKDGSQPYRG